MKQSNLQRDRNQKKTDEVEGETARDPYIEILVRMG